MATTRRRSTAVTIGAVVIAATSLTGCASGSDYGRVCTDQKTNVRLSDDECREGSRYSGAHGWYYIPAGTRAPAVGARTTGGTFSLPTGKSVDTGSVSAKGGTISKGGFNAGHSSFGG